MVKLLKFQFNYNTRPPPPLTHTHTLVDLCTCSAAVLWQLEGARRAGFVPESGRISGVLVRSRHKHPVWSLILPRVVLVNKHGVGSPRFGINGHHELCGHHLKQSTPYIGIIYPHHIAIIRTHYIPSNKPLPIKSLWLEPLTNYVTRIRTSYPLCHYDKNLYPLCHYD